jgi:hypothetical protein
MACDRKATAARWWSMRMNRRRARTLSTTNFSTSANWAKGTSLHRSAMRMDVYTCDSCCSTRNSTSLRSGAA